MQHANDLFNDSLQPSSDASVSEANQKRFSQYLSPAWFSSMVVEQFYPHLNAGDFVVEPTCGNGSFLNALPASVDAIGVEIDPQLADIARNNTNRTIYTGNALEHHYDRPVSHFIGNPPFTLSFLDAFLEKARNELVEGGTVGFILSCHLLQTSSNIARWSNDWSLNTSLIPRDIYQGLSKPLCFTIFTNDRLRRFVGMALYLETNDVNGLEKEIKSLFVDNGKGGVWARVIEQALIALGGKGSLSEIYSYVEPRKPSKTQFWKEQIRKVVRQGLFVDLGDGHYAHPNCA